MPATVSVWLRRPTGRSYAGLSTPSRVAIDSGAGRRRLGSAESLRGTDACRSPTSPGLRCSTSSRSGLVLRLLGAPHAFDVHRVRGSVGDNELDDMPAHEEEEHSAVGG